MNYGDYQIPLLIAKQTIQGGNIHLQIDRYAGVAFFVGNEGLIATCRHIVQMVQEGEVLVGKSLNTGVIEPIYNIRVHADYDFALGAFMGQPDYRIFPMDGEDCLPGHDVRAFGFNNIGKIGADVRVNARMLKGYIVSKHETSDHPEAKTTTEVSFPSLKGFSGSPLVSTETGKLAGMMFSNHESSIEVHSFMDVEDNGDTFKESIYRVIELGLAHSISDINQFISALKG
ncbi:serine protease [Vibrio sp. VGrn 2]|uniref:S1 family peptidase n=1 Tax=Vibrio sp. VGrn 2 TaxID=2419839 RepID=UPI00128D9573|nr:serine protease [Vibrio sp. VGrn 2]MPS40699.1 serine protease [Vibrio sp. VGrn 2]